MDPTITTQSRFTSGNLSSGPPGLRAGSAMDRPVLLTTAPPRGVEGSTNGASFSGLSGR